MDSKNLSDILKELADAAEGENEEREDPGVAETAENDGENDPNQRIPEELNLLPLREVVIVPSLVAPLGVGRENSIKLINDSTEGGNRLIAVACMKDPSVENPTLDDIYKVGTVVAIRMMGQVPEGIKLIVQGLKRFEVIEAIETTPYLKVEVRLIEEPAILEEEKMEIEALKRNIGQLFTKIVGMSPDLPDEMASMPNNVQDPHILTDLIAAQMPRFTFQERQEILETVALKPRMTRLMELLGRERSLARLRAGLERAGGLG